MLGEASGESESIVGRLNFGLDFWRTGGRSGLCGGEAEAEAGDKELEEEIPPWRANEGEGG